MSPVHLLSRSYPKWLVPTPGANRRCPRGDRNGSEPCLRSILEPGLQEQVTTCFSHRNEGRQAQLFSDRYLYDRVALPRRATTSTTTATTSSRPLNVHHTSPLPANTITIPFTTATITTTTTLTTATEILPFLPTNCFMDNQKANEVYDLACSDEPIAPRVKEALGVIDHALDDFE